MADTRQVISWTLAYACPLRQGAAVEEISAAQTAVAPAHTYSCAVKSKDERFCVHEGILITSLMNAAHPPRMEQPVRRPWWKRLLMKAPEFVIPPCCDYPHTGIPMEDLLAKSGGEEQLAICARCPANAQRPAAAGCTGLLTIEPWSKALDEELGRIVANRKLKAVVAEEFVATRPRWFGLWARPVLTPRGAGALATILQELMAVKPHNEEAVYREEQMAALRGAAEIAAAGAIKLCVAIAPPGHTDFGFYTIFAHCPRCKAEADLKRWKGGYPTTPYVCKVCGEGYIPAEQASSEKDGWEPEKSLRETLGVERFKTFAQTYLLRRGMSERDAEETVACCEAREKRWAETAALAHQQEVLRQRYIREVLYAGLPEEVIPPGRDGDAPPGLRADAFEALLERCRARGVRVWLMKHFSPSQGMDRPPEAMLKKMLRHAEFSPEKLLREWRAEGCCDLFTAWLAIPEEVLNAFAVEHAEAGARTLPAGETPE